MRSIVAILLILNSAICFGQFAEFSFDQKKVYKAEAIQEGAVLDFVWTFTNTGDAPLVITDYEVACTCTKAVFSKAPIPPGATGQIEMSFESSGKMGWQYRTIKLLANTKKGQEELEFRVKVINPE